MSTRIRNEIVDALFSPAPIDQESVRRLLQLARRVDAEDIELGNSLVPEAGDYLSEWNIRWLARAEMSDQAAQAQIVEQKRFIARLSDLLPSIIELFEFEEHQSALNLLSCIDDCHNDAMIGLGSPRKDKALREALESIDRASTSLATAIQELKAARRWVDHDFARHCTAIRTRRKNRADQPYKEENKDSIDYKDVLDQLGVLLSTLKIKYHRALTEDDQLFVSDNQVRTDVVHFAHTMSRYWNGPPLVTTPGAVFSTLCSLLYEAATGIRDESLSGAINRYARSEKRKTFDREDDEITREQDEPDMDNFQAAYAEIKRCREIWQEYQKVLSSKEWPVDERFVILSVIDHETAKIKAAEDEYGPHLVWAHQLRDWKSYDLDKSKKVMRDLDVAIGKLRRSGVNWED